MAAHPPAHRSRRRQADYFGTLSKGLVLHIAGPKVGPPMMYERGALSKGPGVPYSGPMVGPTIIYLVPRAGLSQRAY